MRGGAGTGEVEGRGRERGEGERGGGGTGGEVSKRARRGETGRGRGRGGDGGRGEVRGWDKGEFPGLGRDLPRPLCRACCGNVRRASPARPPLPRARAASRRGDAGILLVARSAAPGRFAGAPDLGRGLLELDARLRGASGGCPARPLVSAIHPVARWPPERGDSSARRRAPACALICRRQPFPRARSRRGRPALLDRVPWKAPRRPS